MNNKIVRLAVILAVLAAVESQANLVGFLQKTLGPQPIQLDGSPVPEKSVSVDSFKQLKDCKKVVVTQFNVQFITAKKASAHAGHEGMDSCAYVKSDVKLTGLDTNVFQTITDMVYSNFVAGLKGLGLEVMPYAEYAAQPDYANMRTYMRDAPLLIPAGIFSGQPSWVFTPQGMPIPIYGDEVAMNSIGQAFSQIGKSAPQALEPQLSKQTGVATVHVYLVVDFCQLEASGGSFAFTAKVDTKPQLSISKISRCSFFFGNSMSGGREFVKLKNDGFGQTEYVTELKDVTTTGQKVADDAKELIGILGGTGGHYKTRSYEAVADPAIYQSACIKYLNTIEDLMVAGIKSKTAK